MLKYLKAFFIGIRPKTLPASQVPALMASAWVFYKKEVLDIKILIGVLVSVGLIQCTVNLLNDAIDYKTGTDGKDRKGPTRLTESGMLSYEKVLFLGFLCAGLAILSGIPLVLRGGWPIFIMGTASLCLCYLYSGSRFALVKQAGLSDLLVIVFFGYAIVGGVYYLQTLEWENSLSILGFQCGLWSLSILLVNNLRDYQEDKKSGRDNFIIRYGREFGLLQLSCVQAFIYLMSFYWMDIGFSGGAFTFFLLPFSIFLIYKISITDPSPKYNQFLFFMSLLYMTFGFLWVLGCFI